jgi:hypothetical protein
MNKERLSSERRMPTHTKQYTFVILLCNRFQSQTKEHCIAVQELQDNLRLTGNHEQVALAKNVQFVERTQVLENELTALRKDLRTTEEKFVCSFFSP